jgi:hypothetical protein
VDLSAFSTSALLRWDMATRVALAVSLPVLVSLLTGGLGVVAVTAALSAALTSLASLGPDLSTRPWVLVAAVGVPAAIVLGAGSTRLPTGGVLVVFLLFTAYGALARAGLLAQMAWFPVAIGGMVAALLVAPGTNLGDIAAGAAAGSLLALVLMLVVARVVRAPRLAVPAGALAVDTDRLRRMVTAPTWWDWGFPLLLGGVSASILVVFDLLTGGFRPYWAVLAFVSVLAPSVAATRRSVVETIAAAAAGVLLAGIVLATRLPVAQQLVVITMLGVVGALLMLRQGLVSKALLTPLPVVGAAAALGQDAALALPVRLGEYVVGAVLGLGVVVVTARVSERLEPGRADEADEADATA